VAKGRKYGRKGNKTDRAIRPKPEPNMPTLNELVQRALHDSSDAADFDRRVQELRAQAREEVMSTRLPALRPREFDGGNDFRIPFEFKTQPKPETPTPTVDTTQPRKMKIKP